MHKDVDNGTSIYNSDEPTSTQDVTSPALAKPRVVECGIKPGRNELSFAYENDDADVDDVGAFGTPGLVDRRPNLKKTSEHVTNMETAIKTMIIHVISADSQPRSTDVVMGSHVLTSHLLVCNGITENFCKI